MTKRRVASISRSLMVCSLGVCLSVPGRTQPVTPRAVIDRYCTGCHNDKVKAGGLALNTLNPENAGANPEIWEKVIRKLRVHYMPPAGAPQPDARTLRRSPRKSGNIAA